jgi:hypothetical protein
MHKILIFIYFQFIVAFCAMLFAQVNKVTITADAAGQWQLKVNNENYYIKGGGGTVQLDVLKSCGGNTIRTWGIENAQEILDAAQKMNMKVMLGMWVQHERHGFDYDNTEKIAAQLESFRLAVRKYKNHPALLLWGVGNEYELEYSNTKVWAVVNDIAKMVKEEDPNHPTSTVTAGTNPEKLKFVQEFLTAIDIYGINTYGDIEGVEKVLRDGQYQGPYMITEWGPNGHWESPKTKWGTSIEQTSTEKTKVYLDRYQKCIAGQGKQCIGSFAFLWGQKQEYTHTWYGLFNEAGMPTEAIDALEFDFTGKYPENRSPSVDSIHFNGQILVKNVILNSKEKYAFEVFAKDLNQDKLSYEWELYPESTDLKSGGDAEAKPTLIPGKLKGKNSSTVQVVAPNSEGRYRLFVTVSDGKKIAYLNVPFYVQYDANSAANAKSIQFKKQDLKSFDEE